jgi:hypothetical protein
MKNPLKICISLALFYFFIISITFSQKTIDESKIWTIRSGGFGPNYNSFAIKFLGDTTINNILYKKMLGSHDSLLVNGWVQSNIFMREDSLHRVFQYQENSEKLLYDFTLELGDTFIVTHNFWDTCKLIVQNIDSIELNNSELRKRFYLVRHDDPTPNQPWYGYIYWIQGIGSLTHLTEYPWTCFFDNPYHLLCYIENDEYLYTSPSFNSCFVSPTSEVQPKEIKIYPNPTFGIIHIESEFEIESISLFDLTGKEMRIEFNNYEINLSKLQSGIYFLKAQFTNNKEFRKSIIKIE